MIERLGTKYYRYLGETSGTAALRNATIDELPDDATLQTLAGGARRSSSERALFGIRRLRRATFCTAGGSRRWRSPDQSRT